MSQIKQEFQEIQKHYKTVQEKADSQKKITETVDKELTKKIKLIGDTSKEIVEYIEKRSEK